MKTLSPRLFLDSHQLSIYVPLTFYLCYCSVQDTETKTVSYRENEYKQKEAILFLKYLLAVKSCISISPSKVAKVGPIENVFV